MDLAYVGRLLQNSALASVLLEPVLDRSWRWNDIERLDD